MMSYPGKRLYRQLVAVLGTLTCFAAISAASADGTTSGVDNRGAVHWWSGRSPVGVWKMQVTFVACDTGAALRAPFPALNTFYADGNISEVGAGLGPAFRSASHGRWAWTGKNALAIKSEIQLFDSNFIYYADQVFDRRFQLSEDGNSMTGKATYVRYGVDGSEIFRGCAVEDGTRQPGPAK